jgi:hypothetical protein
LNFLSLGVFEITIAAGYYLFSKNGKPRVINKIK